MSRYSKAPAAAPAVPMVPAVPALKAPAAGTKNKAQIIGVIGASGVGKSSYIKSDLLKKYTRLLIWSPLEETDNYASFCGGTVTHKITDFIAAIRRQDKAIIFVPSGSSTSVKKQFDLFCRCVWEVEGAHVLVEELSQVTMPSWAPPAWKKLSSAGRHKGLTLIGASQRPASIDKDFLGNCSEIRCYRVNYDRDAAVMADTLGLGAAWVQGENGKTVQVKAQKQIRDLPNFHFFHKNPDLSVRQGVNKSL